MMCLDKRCFLICGCRRPASPTWMDCAIREKCPEVEEAGKRAIQAARETGCHDWHKWRAGAMKNFFEDGHWGTKWNACHFAPLENVADKRADIECSTAWSPPEPVIIALSQRFPTLNFTLRYWECGFRGILRVKAGQILRNDYFEYHGTKGG